MLPLQFVNTVDKLVRQFSTTQKSHRTLRIQFLCFGKFCTERLDCFIHFVSDHGRLRLRGTHESFLRLDNRFVSVLPGFISSVFAASFLTLMRRTPLRSTRGRLQLLPLLSVLLLVRLQLLLQRLNAFLTDPQIYTSNDSRTIHPFPVLR